MFECLEMTTPEAVDALSTSNISSSTAVPTTSSEIELVTSPKSGNKLKIFDFSFSFQKQI